MSKTNLVWMLAAVCMACTSTNDPTVIVVDGGSDAKKADSGPAKDSGSSTDNDSGSTTEGDSSAPKPCTPTSGGLPCDAKKVYCGSTTCAVGQDCCVNTSTGAATCAATGSCAGSTAGLSCDEAGDCAAGEVCCFTASGTTPTGSLCQTGPCGLGDFSQSCRSDSECAGSGQCVSGSCAGYKIQTCAAIPSTACGN